MTDEMDHPVTRRELREELTNHATRKELHDALEIWGGAINARIDRLSSTFSVEMARQIQASEERMRDFLRALMDPHHGVPERVTGLEARVDRLEAKVLAPKRRRRTARRR